ncbi:HD domain-containing protein [Chryseobacterium gregarium]|uniref:HD domain-containing protein n=1 Tax=Chryseobacterium gregarium TaxID=456299 RepID=UPI000406556D|nr:hypothetical protein [Chryseobacterium gregarium]
MNLKERFSDNCFLFTADKILVGQLWSDIDKKHTEKGRHYHNLSHLENMFTELEALRSKIGNFTEISFSVFYHDVIYDATSKSNEEKSAEFAASALQQLNIPKDTIKRISDQIIATKLHQKSGDRDTNYFLDADLSILGKDLETYIDYAKKIRKEYSIYPDLLYQPGRKKVLKHFLALERIFKTQDFMDIYEIKARENMLAEMESL